jgi:hypothetical protein
MEMKRHIEMSKLMGAILDGKTIPEAAVNAARQYAQELEINTDLRNRIRAKFNASLAERDYRRARQLLAKYAPKPAKAEEPELHFVIPSGNFPEPPKPVDDPLVTVIPHLKLISTDSSVIVTFNLPPFFKLDPPLVDSPGAIMRERGLMSRLNELTPIGKQWLSTHGVEV